MTKTEEKNWGPALFLIIYQTLLLIGLPFYFYFYTPSLGLIGASVALLYLTGFSITAGYHRYFSHKSFKTNSIVEAILLFFGAMSAQGSALRWGFDHRIHHAYVDTDEDPYTIKKGFWFAHFNWIWDKPKTIEPKVVPDLLKNKLVVFQHTHIGKLMVATNLIAFLFIGFIINDYIGAFVIALWLRMFALHHFTWFINSLAHTWGEKPFCQEQTAVDNYFLSMLTFGEGYHNYHHTFANDYRNGIKWYHWDPTKWVIWTLHKLGLAHHLRRIDPLTIKKRMVIEQKNILLERLTKAWHAKKEEIAGQVNEISDQILAKLNEFNTLCDKYNKFKSEQAARGILNEIRREIRNLKKDIRDDWRRLKGISRAVLQAQIQLA